MKVKNLFRLTSVALGVSLFAACNNKDIDLTVPETTPEGSTYMSVSLSMPQRSGTRALDEDYNTVGKFAGQDEVQKIEVYIFNEANALEGGVHTFNAGQFQVQVPVDNMVTIKPLKGMKVQPGQKTVYVVVNPTNESSTHLAGKVTLSDFEDAYQKELTLQTAGDKNTAVSTAADKVSKIVDNKDIILMTAKAAGKVNVEDGVTESTVLSSETNRAKLEVKRAVARVMISYDPAISMEIKGDDGLTQDIETDFVQGKVSELRYVVAQGEKSFYFQQKQNFETPNYSYVPESATYDAAKEKYDYAGLWRNYSDSEISGIEIPNRKLYNSASSGEIADDLKKKLWGEFLLPNVHESGQDQTSTKYRKGNTAYVLVRGKFTPSKVVMDNGTIENNYPGNKDFFLGKNGVFYESNTAAHDATKYGVPKQETTCYVKGKVIYYAWINPDMKTVGWLNSPVVRNNIYHIEIAGFAKIGTNWNPLVPSNPNDQNDPTYPANPDPKPENPSEPENPIKPDDPLTPKETWMAVQTTILPWQVHSYKVTLGQ